MDIASLIMCNPVPAVLKTMDIASFTYHTNILMSDSLYHHTKLFINF